MQRDADRANRGGTQAGIVSTTLDVTFGFIVWALHFLLIYIAHATACVLDLGIAIAATQLFFRFGLIVVTLATLALIGVHALRTYRSRPRHPDEFLRNLTLGNDAIASIGVAWQLYPITLLPLCY